MRLRNIPGSAERIEKSEFCVQSPKEHKGRWNEVFGNDNPIHIEIGMGKGRFLMDLAKKNPGVNYIGIEMYSSVLVKAIDKAEELKSRGCTEFNFRFIRMDARELAEVFAYGEVGRIYLNFSDPWPKDRHAKRRLTSVQFLKRYEEILPRDSVIEFKTDNKDLFDFSLEQAKEENWNIRAYTYDLHNDAAMNEGNIMTEYEEKFSAMGNPIHKMIISQE